MLLENKQKKFGVLHIIGKINTIIYVEFIYDEEKETWLAKSELFNISVKVPHLFPLVSLKFQIKIEKMILNWIKDEIDIEKKLIEDYGFKNAGIYMGIHKLENKNPNLIENGASISIEKHNLNNWITTNWA